MVFAKTPQSQNKISTQFSNRQVKKTYLALGLGPMEAKEGSLESRIARHPGKRQRFAVSSLGRWARTRFRVVEILGKEATLLEVFPLTGRTHQIRVQLAAYHHPILGDHVYGEKSGQVPLFQRQMLHAHKLEFSHPKTGKKVHYEAPLPPDFQKAIKILRSR